MFISTTLWLRYDATKNSISWLFCGLCIYTVEVQLLTQNHAVTHKIRNWIFLLPFSDGQLQLVWITFDSRFTCLLAWPVIWNKDTLYDHKNTSDNQRKFYIWGTPVPITFHRWGPIWCAKADRSVHLYKPNFICICLLCRLSVNKNHNFGQIFDIWGLLYWHLFTDEGQIWCAIEQGLVYASVPNFVSISLFWRPLAAKTLKFCRFLDFGIFWCRQLAKIWESWTRLHNYKPSPIQRYQNRFCTPTHGEIGRTISDVQKRDEQTK